MRQNQDHEINVNLRRRLIACANIYSRKLGIGLVVALLFCCLQFIGIASQQTAHDPQCVHCSAMLLSPASRLLGVDARSAVQEPPQQCQPEGGARADEAPKLEQLRKSNHELSVEVERLKKKVARLEHDRSRASIHERLSKEEQRAETLQAQLLVIAEKDAAVQARQDQVTEQLRPENIAGLAVAGSLHPEEIREATRRTLSNEMHRLQSQTELLHQSRDRLQSSLAHSDAIVLRLRAELSQDPTAVQ